MTINKALLDECIREVQIKVFGKIIDADYLMLRHWVMMGKPVMMAFGSQAAANKFWSEIDQERRRCS